MTQEMTLKIALGGNRQQYNKFRGLISVFFFFFFQSKSKQNKEYEKEK